MRGVLQYIAFLPIVCVLSIAVKSRLGSDCVTCTNASHISRACVSRCAKP